MRLENEKRVRSTPVLVLAHSPPFRNAVVHESLEHISVVPHAVLLVAVRADEEVFEAFITLFVVFTSLLGICHLEFSVLELPGELFHQPLCQRRSLAGLLGKSLSRCLHPLLLPPRILAPRHA